MKFSFEMLFTSLTAVLMLGCSSSASKDSPCQRSCGSRPVGGGNLKGLAYTDSLKFTCASGQTIPQQSLYFLIYEDNPKKPTTTPDGGGGSGDSGESAHVPERLPKAGIAFTPTVPAGVTLESPSSDWCTDSCGIAEIKFTPICGWTVDSVITPIVPGMTVDEVPKTSFSLSLP